jgi:hypothetical protein
MNVKKIGIIIVAIFAIAGLVSIVNFCFRETGRSQGNIDRNPTEERPITELDKQITERQQRAIERGEQTGERLSELAESLAAEGTGLQSAINKIAILEQAIIDLFDMHGISTGSGNGFTDYDTLDKIIGLE